MQVENPKMASYVIVTSGVTRGNTSGTASASINGLRRENSMWDPVRSDGQKAEPSERDLTEVLWSDNEVTTVQVLEKLHNQLGFRVVATCSIGNSVKYTCLKEK